MNSNTLQHGETKEVSKELFFGLQALVANDSDLPQALHCQVRKVLEDSHSNHQKEIEDLSENLLAHVVNVAQGSSSSPFDKWVSLWPKATGPPPEMQAALAKLLVRSENSKSDQTLDPYLEHETVVANDESEEENPEAGSIKEADVVSWLGVSVDWFLQCFLELPEIQAFRSFGCRMWFVRNVGITLIFQRRRIPKGSILNHLETLGSFHSTQDTASPDNVVFISYTGSISLDLFAELVQSPQLQGKYIWTDTMCVNQFAWREQKTEAMVTFKNEFMDRLLHKIKEFGSTMLFLDQWDSLPTVLRQIWVIWELYATVAGEASLDVLFSSKERKRLISEGLEKGDGIHKIRAALADVDVANATAFDPMDREIILLRMKQHDGIFQTNQMVAERIRTWVKNTAESLVREQMEACTSVYGLPTLLGSIYSELGHFSKAEALYRAELELCKEKFGDRHYITLHLQKSYAGQLAASGKHEIAETIIRETLDTLEKEYFEDIEILRLDARGTLAGILFTRGKYKESETCFQSLVPDATKEFGEDHESTLHIMSGFAAVLEALNLVSEAEATYRQVLRVRREKLGSKHRKTIMCVNSLAGLLQKMRRSREAEKLFVEALEGAREQLGDEHPDTLGILNNVASLGFNLVASEDLHRISLQKLREVLGDKHPSTLDSINNLAITLKNEGKLEEAAPLYGEVLTSRMEVLGEKHPDTLMSIDNMGILCQCMLHVDNAEQLFRLAWKGRDEVLGGEHPDTLTTMSNLAVLLSEYTSNNEEAKILHEKALEGRKRTLGALHPDTLDSMYNTGLVLAEMGSLVEAKKLLIEACDGFVAVHGETYKYVQHARDAITKLQGILSCKTPDENDQKESSKR